MNNSSATDSNVYSKENRKRSLYKYRSRRRSSRHRKNKRDTTSSVETNKNNKTELIQKAVTWTASLILAYLVYSVITTEDMGEWLGGLNDGVRNLLQTVLKRV